MNALTPQPRSAFEVISVMPVLEREITLMERAIALHDRHAELKRQMEERGLDPIASAVRMTEIAEAVAVKRGLTLEDLLGPSRRSKVCEVRQEAMWHMRERRWASGEHRWSLPQIGAYFGRDHSTVLWGIHRHQARIEAAR